jgi:hypothetical protein
LPADCRRWASRDATANSASRGKSLLTKIRDQNRHQPSEGGLVPQRLAPPFRTAQPARQQMGSHRGATQRKDGQRSQESLLRPTAQSPQEIEPYHRGNAKEGHERGQAQRALSNCISGRGEVQGNPQVRSRLLLFLQ